MEHPHDEVFWDWEWLLTACEELAPKLPPDFYECFCVPLERHLRLCREAKAEQDALVAAEREVARRLNLTIKEGQKMAMEARQVLREAGAPRLVH